MDERPAGRSPRRAQLARVYDGTAGGLGFNRIAGQLEGLQALVNAARWDGLVVNRITIG